MRAEGTERLSARFLVKMLTSANVCEKKDRQFLVSLSFICTFADRKIYFLLNS
jgi:hypothetical protein